MKNKAFLAGLCIIILLLSSLACAGISLSVNSLSDTVGTVDINNAVITYSTFFKSVFDLGRRGFAKFMGVADLINPENWIKACNNVIETIRTVPKTIVDLHRNYPEDVVKKVVTSVKDYICLAKADSIAKLPSKADFNVYKNADLTYLVFKKNVGKLVKKNIANEDAVQAVRRLIDKFDSKIMEDSVEILSKFADKSATAIKLTGNMADGVGNIIKHGSKANADAVVDMYDKEVAEAVFESAGKYMENTIKQVVGGKHFNKGMVIDKIDSLKRHKKSLGTLDTLERNRIFVADSSLIDKSRLTDNKYLEELEGILGVKKGKFTSGEIGFVEFERSFMDTKSIKVPDAYHSNENVFLPNTGATIGGIPERVISGGIDISGQIKNAEGVIVS